MDSKGKYLYFICVEKTHYSFTPGSICYIEERRYLEKFKNDSNPEHLPVMAMGSMASNNVKVTALQHLSETEAGLLQAIGEDTQRLRYFLQRGELDSALALKIDTPVSVEIRSEWCQGVLRYIGSITSSPALYTSHKLPGIFFGIELQGNDKGKGEYDGTYMSRTFFCCEKNCGIFAPFNRVRPARSRTSRPQPLTSWKPPAASTEPLNPGDRVQVFLADNSFRQGVVIALKKEEAGMCAVIAMRGEKQEQLTVPLECAMKQELLSPPEADMDWQDSVSSVWSLDGDEKHLSLSLNSVVEVSLSEGRTVYGTVRWIGRLPDSEGIRVGLELEEDKGVSDGTFKGRRLFQCPPKRGLFVRQSSCRPDSRFQPPGKRDGKASGWHTVQGSANSHAVPSTVAPLWGDQAVQVLSGQMKGIQGHCNSCYMDATLFSLFSCSSVLDSLLFKSAQPSDALIQATLLREIVNPLRIEGYVEASSVMKLRKQLMEGGHCASFTTDEKDPEEFLNLVMHHILALDPLLKLKTAEQKVQDGYCYQIFIDQNNSLALPTVQQLLEHSFHSALLRLAEVPSCLILQMPRFGKKFKLFDKIIPSLELDITDLLSDSPQECVLCGELAIVECAECFRDATFSNTGFKQFCYTCSKQVHSLPRRRKHVPSALQLPEGYTTGKYLRPPREQLELFAVLCIETSHYVSFVKYGPSSQDWIFFDSMADRYGDEDGYNIPAVQLCPEVGRYLEMPLGELAAVCPRDMEGVAKRLFCDAYMYLYQSPSMALYR
ncbi:CYLD hydrolase, partial [Atractosteus spatula]|nr:CYLD hydrolase [Atractosteus spatula]